MAKRIILLLVLLVCLSAAHSQFGKFKQVETDSIKIGPKWYKSFDGNSTTIINGTNSSFSLDTAFFWDGHNNTIPVYTYGSQINSISVLDSLNNGSGYVNFYTSGDTTFIHFPISPYGQLHYLLQGSGIKLYPTGLNAVPASDTSIQLSWHKVANAASYSLELSYDSIEYGQIAKLAPDDTGYLHTGLAPHQRYFYRIRADPNTADPNYISSDFSYASALTATLAPLQMPSNFIATAISKDTVIATWSASPNAVAYFVQYSSDTTTWYNANGSGIIPASQLRDTITLLNSNTLFWVRAKAIANPDFYFDSPFAIDTAMTKPAPDTSVIPPLATPNFNAAATSPYAVVVNWNLIAGATGYRIEHSRDSLAWTVDIIKTASNVTSYTIANLQPSTLYYVRGFAVANGTTKLNSSYGFTSATTLNEIVTPLITEVGIVSDPDSSGLSQPLLVNRMIDSLGADVGRAGTFLFVNSIPSSGNTILNAGNTLQLNVSSYQSNGARNFVMANERAGYVGKVKNLMTTYLKGKKIKWLMASNEEINATYRNLDSAYASPTNSAYLYFNNEFKVNDSLADALAPGQMKIVNGGWPGKPMFWMAWRNLMDSNRVADANELAYQVFMPSERKALATWDKTGPHALVLTVCKQLITYYQMADFEYMNLHIKLPINGIDSSHLDPNVIRFTVEAFKNLTGKKIVTNEIAARSTNPAITSELLAGCVNNGMELIGFYDGLGFPWNAQPLTAGADVSLRKETDRKTLNSAGLLLKQAIRQLKSPMQ